MGSSGISMPCFIIIRYFEPVCFMHPDLVKNNQESSLSFSPGFACAGVIKQALNYSF